MCTCHARWSVTGPQLLEDGWIFLDCCEDKIEKKKQQQQPNKQKKHVALNLLEHGPAY